MFARIPLHSNSNSSSNHNNSNYANFQIKMCKKPKGRLKLEPKTTQTSSISDAGRTLLFVQLLAALSSSLIVVAGANEPATTNNLRLYHATLPKVGLISGLTIDPRQSRASGGHDDNEHDHDHDEPLVVGFLGIPYAAAPIGPLRFMPPGALQLTSQQQQQQSRPKQQQLVLMPAGQPASARPFNRLGSRCVHLADWLNHSNVANDHQDNNQDQFLLPKQQQQQSAAQSEWWRQRSLKRKQQSEDCLNLNVFVPIASRRRAIITSQQEQQQQHSIGSKSDLGATQTANHAQFGHQGLAAGRQSSASHEPHVQGEFEPLPLVSQLLSPAKARPATRWLSRSIYIPRIHYWCFLVHIVFVVVVVVLQRPHFGPARGDN